MKYVTAVPVGQRKSQPTNPVNAYQLTATFMHGDADAYTTESMLFKENHVGLIPYIEAFMNAPDYLYSAGDWTNYLTTMGHDQPFIDSVCDFVPWDITNDYSNYALIEKVEVTYFDVNGIEHHTQIVVEERDTD